MPNITENTNKWISVYTIALALEEEYGISIPDHILFKHVEKALEKISALAPTEYIYKACIEDYKLYIPCNCDEILSVKKVINLHGSQIFRYSSLNKYSQPMESEQWNTQRRFANDWKDNVSTLPFGPDVDYRWQDDKDEIGNYAVTNLTDIEVYVLYKGYKSDENGYPMICEAHQLYVEAYVHERVGFARKTAKDISMEDYQLLKNELREQEISATQLRFNMNSLNKALKMHYGYNRQNMFRL